MLLFTFHLQTNKVPIFLELFFLLPDFTKCALLCLLLLHLTNVVLYFRIPNLILIIASMLIGVSLGCSEHDLCYRNITDLQSYCCVLLLSLLNHKISKVVPIHAMKAYRLNRGMAQLILSLDTRSR